MHNILSRVGILLCLLAVVACKGNVRETLGLKPRTPDEFRVVSNLPLSVPPDFRLEQPRPGAKRPQSQEISEQARTLVLGEVEAPEGLTEAEVALLQEARAQDVGDDIRRTLDEEERLHAEKEAKDNLWNKVVDYTKGDAPKEDPIVNARKEKARIKEATEEGSTVTGADTPEITKKDKGLLGKLGL